MTDGAPSEILALESMEIEEYFKMVNLWNKKIKAQTAKNKKSWQR